MIPTSGNHANFDIEKETKFVTEKYGKHIPSLIIETRDELHIS